MKKLLTLTLLATLFSTQASAGELYLHGGGFSKHLQERKGTREWREVHNNIGLEYQQSVDTLLCQQVSGVVETFKNSMNRRSIAAYGTCKQNWGRFRTGQALGYVSGYRETKVGAFPFIETDINKVGVQVGFLPVDAGVFFVKFKVKLGEF